jgi:hypothetical protein
VISILVASIVVNGRSVVSHLLVGQTTIMEKQPPPPPGGTVDLDMLKARSHLDPRDVDLGQVLEMHTTPEMERKVLWKLDL